MLRSHSYIVIAGLVISFCLTACGGPIYRNEAQFFQAVSDAVRATLTQEAAWAEADAQVEATEPAPTATQPPPPDTPTPSPTPEEVILHEMIPEDPTGREAFVSDLTSYDNAAERSTIGDYYQINRLERPFTAFDMEYFGDLDIVRVDLDAKSPWFYFTFILADEVREEGEIYYGIELDTDADGRGEILVWAVLPPDSEWTTDGVQVREDTDGDVGGIYPAFMNDPDPNLTGYETELFFSGRGDDPDLAWVRRDPEETKQIQIAIKEDVPGPLGFLWSAWADGGVMDPKMFEYNDQITHEKAGSPTEGELYYPLKEVALVDSTCRSWYGMTPDGDEAGLCTAQWLTPPGSGGRNSDGGGNNGGQPQSGFCVYDPTSGDCGNNPCLPACPPQAPRCLSCTLP